MLETNNMYLSSCVCVCVCQRERERKRARERERLVLIVFWVLVILLDMCNTTALLACWSAIQCLWSHLWIIVIFTGDWQGNYCNEVWVMGIIMDGWKDSKEDRYAVCGVRYWHPYLRTGCWGGYLTLWWRKWYVAVRYYSCISTIKMIYFAYFHATMEYGIGGGGGF